MTTNIYKNIINTKLTKYAPQTSPPHTS